MSVRAARMVQQAQEHRRQELERVSDQLPRTSIVDGHALIGDAGETTVTVDFPFTFMEMPVFTCGWALDDNQSVASGSFPICSAFVMSWKTITKSGNRTYYTGAELGVVAVAGSGTKLKMHYNFQGKAFRDPAGGTGGSVGGVI